MAAKKQNKSKAVVTKKSPKKKTSAPVKKKSAKKEKKPAAKKKKGEDLMCFLTTACVHYYNLSDDCLELNTLRNYRDNYLLKTDDGKKLVSRYYEIAPGLVKKIIADKGKHEVYHFIYKQIKKACAEILNEQLFKAKETYTKMVRMLLKKYRAQLTL